MSYELDKIQDNIIRLAFIGDINESDVEALIKDFRPYLEATPPGKSIGLLIDASRDGRMSPSARRNFTKLNHDSRLGGVGICNVGRLNRVMATFVMKATGRDNIHFFDTQAEAIVWLEELNR